VLSKNKDSKCLDDKCIICGESQFNFLFTKKGNTFWQCNNCKFEKQHPLPNGEELEAYYNNSFEYGLYKEFIESSDMKRITAEYRFRKIKPYIYKGRLLDVGCADGVFVQQAILSGINAEGIDISQVAIDRALQRGVPAICSSISNYKPKDLYETITAFDVLEHLLDPVEFFDSIKRLLKAGGILVLTTPNRSSIFRMLMGRRWYFYIPEEHFHYFDSKTVKRLLNRKGFDLISCARFFKPLTIEYGLSQFAEYNPLVYKIMHAFSIFITKRLLRTSIPFYIGEMMLIARNNPI
jgi:SAM-dependent methyltransferase